MELVTYLDQKSILLECVLQLPLDLIALAWPALGQQGLHLLHLQTRLRKGSLAFRTVRFEVAISVKFKMHLHMILNWCVEVALESLLPA